MSHRAILDSLRQMQAFGFDGVEVCLEHPDLLPETLTAELARRVSEELDRLGMPRSVSYHKDYIYDDRLWEQTLLGIELTPQFGADIFIISGCPRRGGPEEWPRMLDRTRRLVSAAAARGVALAIEFEPNFIVGSTADLLRLFREIPSEALQANLDLGHVFLCDPAPMAAIDSLRGKVRHGHVENMRAGVHRHLPPWEGDMDLPAYLRALDGIGFAGPLALDLYNERYEDVAERSVGYLRGILPPA